MPIDIKVVRDEFKRAQDEERAVREDSAEDIRFVGGEQWNAALKAKREAAGKPALTFNKLPTFIQSVANAARMNKQATQVSPIGGGSTEDVAVVLNGIKRHIDYRSRADIAKDTALDYSAAGGFGFIRFITEYCSPESFDQDVKILTVQDPFSIYGALMPACRGQKCRKAWVVETISKEEYRLQYGNGEPTSWDSSEWRDAGDWVEGDNVRIAEYWYVEPAKKTLRLLVNSDGSTKPVYLEDLEGDIKALNLPWVPGPEDDKPLERKVDVDQVKFCKISGTGVIPDTETDWVGDSIPIVAVLGRQMIIDGQVKLISLVRFARDPQQLLNIYKSGIAQKIALQNKVPYVGPIGSFTDSKWLDANTVDYAFLEYTPVEGPNGQVMPPPQRQAIEEQIQALSMAANAETDDLKSIMGIFDPSLGERSNETSGIGIARRQQQSNITNYHFVDNLNRAEWELSQKLLKVIPKVYDRPGRQVRIVGDDQKHSVVVVNQPYKDPETGQQKHFPLDVGDYDVVVTTGPDYSTARLEGAETLGNLFKAAPQLVPLLGDLWMGSLDYSWSREAARRLKAAAPQNIVADPKDQGEQQVPPQFTQQLQQAQQEAQQAHAFAQSLHEQMQSKAQEIESKERMHAQDLQFAREKLQVETELGMAKYASTEAVEELRQELAALKHESELEHQRAMQAADHDHAAQLQADAQNHQVAMQPQTSMEGQA